MTKSKSITFVLFFVITLLAAGYLLYTRQNEAVVITQSLKNTNQVKGADSTISITTTKPLLSVGEYTKKNSLAHLELTRENIIWYTNYERVQNKLKPLNTSSTLNTSSHAKGIDMFQYQYFDHSRDGGNGSIGFDSFIDNQNYSFIKIGENLAMGDFSTSAEVVTAWMKSPAHRRNILDPLYSEIGVSVNKGSMNNRQTTILIQHFGDPRGNCPAIDTATKRAIDTLRAKITSLQVTINTEQNKVTNSSSALDPQFNTIIDDYNALVKGYNESIKQMGNLVNLYNAQVHNFDRCLQTGKQ